jgi:hypothetical protein
VLEAAGTATADTTTQSASAELWQHLLWSTFASGMHACMHNCQWSPFHVYSTHVQACCIEMNAFRIKTLHQVLLKLSVSEASLAICMHERLSISICIMAGRLGHHWHHGLASKGCCSAHFCMAVQGNSEHKNVHHPNHYQGSTPTLGVMQGV